MTAKHLTRSAAVQYNAKTLDELSATIDTWPSRVYVCVYVSICGWESTCVWLTDKQHDKTKVTVTKKLTINANTRCSQLYSCLHTQKGMLDFKWFFKTDWDL